MAKEINLDLSPRGTSGKQVKRLRKQGILPGVLYGYNVGEPTAVQVDERTFERVYRQAGGSTLIRVNVGDGRQSAQAIIHKVRRDPVTHVLIHFDLMAINPRVEMTTDVPVVLVGEAPGAAAADAILMHELNAVSLRGLPADLPHTIEVDVSVLEEVDQAIHVGDLSMPANVTVLTAPEQLIVKLTQIRVSPEIEEVEAAEAAAAVADEAAEEEIRAEARAEAEGRAGDDES